MDSSLHEIWQTASGSPFQPTVGKGSQFLLAFILLALGFSLSGAFALNRSFLNLTVLAAPASLALANRRLRIFPPLLLPGMASSVGGSVPPKHPLFRAVASSTRQIYQLLKCISFSTKVDVQLTQDGIRFAADHARVMQGVAFLDQSLFTTYTLNWPEDADSTPRFQINLSALLESLQIFGATDAASRAAKSEADPYRSNLRNYRPDFFNHQTLGMPGTCCFVYEEDGSPLGVILKESGVKTQCNMVTYTPDEPVDIPFDRGDIAFKIIMQARWLLDSLSELAPMSPIRLAISALPDAPFLKFSSGGGICSTSVDFSNGRDLLETFSVREAWTHSYKFDMVKSASEAMRIATKVSFRGDAQGVLSLQFMVENESGGGGGGAQGPAVNFLDFRFVPYNTQEDEESESESNGDD
ncbi:DNA repair exonuclease-like protein [Xylariaceae sp. FL0255]|nr:DNA repair exonuclease-like protein [Xylariaceae sp. FL0255]